MKKTGSRANQKIVKLKVKALNCFRENRLSDASRLYSQYCKLSPSDAEAWFMLGAIYAQLNQLAQAADCFHRAIAILPGYPQSHLNLGIVLLKMGELEAAEAALQKTLKIQPDNIDAQEVLAHLCWICYVWTRQRKFSVEYCICDRKRQGYIIIWAVFYKTRGSLRKLRIATVKRFVSTLD